MRSAKNYRGLNANAAANDEHIYASRVPVPGAVRDPVCHMTVSPDSPHRLEHEGATYRFCTARCLEKFRQWPKRYAHSAQGRHA